VKQNVDLRLADFNEVSMIKETCLTTLQTNWNVQHCLMWLLKLWVARSLNIVAIKRYSFAVTVFEILSD